MGGWLAEKPTWEILFLGDVPRRLFAFLVRGLSTAADRMFAAWNSDKDCLK